MSLVVDRYLPFVFSFTKDAYSDLNRVHVLDTAPLDSCSCLRF